LNVVVIGAGSVGLALAATLGQVGACVRVLTRSRDAAAAMRREGILRTGLFGDARLDASQLRVETDVDSLRGSAPDFILVCTKTTESRSVARALSSIWRDLASEPRVVLFQNGWGNSEVFAEHLPAPDVFCTSILVGFQRENLRSAAVTVHAKAIQVGSLFGASETAVAELAAAITRGGIPCEATPHVGRELWAKMLYNCALNPLGALLRVSYGALADSAHTRAVMDQVVGEVFAVMEACGHSTFWKTAADYLDSFYGEILPPTRAHESSMLQDLRAGRRTEIDALSGAIVRLGREHGISTPANDALATLIRAQDGSADRAGVS